MYSAVLMMALAGSGESPECHLFRHCCGCSAYYSCYGCYGCSGCYGCTGCYGYRTGCYGCYGCYGGCFGYCTGSLGFYGNVVVPNPGPGMVPPGTPPMNPPMKPAEPGTPLLPPPGGSTRAPASIQVNLPAEAVVYFDGFRTTVNGNRRFVTPALDRGKTYFYTVKVEMNHDGQTVTATERVIVRAGDQAQVSINVGPTGTVTARQD